MVTNNHLKVFKNTKMFLDRISNISTPEEPIPNIIYNSLHQISFRTNLSIVNYGVPFNPNMVDKSCSSIADDLLKAFSFETPSKNTIAITCI